MQRDDALNILTRHREELHQKFGVKALALFGSTSRNEATKQRDVDLLVEFDRPTGLFGLIRLQLYLETILGRAVDVGTIDALKPRVRSRVLADTIYVN